MNDGIVELAESLEPGDESPDGTVRVVDGAVVDGGLIVERAIAGDDLAGGRNDGVGFIEPEVEKEGSVGVAVRVAVAVVGAAGPQDFDKNGDVAGLFSKNTVVDGKWKPVVIK